MRVGLIEGEEIELMFRERTGRAIGVGISVVIEEETEMREEGVAATEVCARVGIIITGGEAMGI